MDMTQMTTAPSVSAPTNTFLSDYVFCQEGFDHLRRKGEGYSQSFSIPLIVIEGKFDSR
ncbi:hypothetical protein [Leptolyngbya sp. BC1307]|uniref:hypothetical protein n=1 Tax=Leptolyngbya sp. BC1307 TaxID=2029589 RepID=UPI001482B5F0|nr:hypothetical protein [Leptolyngbya sp. BC1307]